MITPELYKIRHHRTPLVLMAMASLAAAAPAVYFLFRKPSPDLYTVAATGVFIALATLIGSVFGGWLLGHEYRQGTLRRVLALDSRRGRFLAAKAVAGSIGLAVVLGGVLAVGLGAAFLVATVQGQDLVTEGLGDEILIGLIPSAIAAAIAFGASAIFRSDTYAMLTSIALLLVVGPTMGLIPRVGQYSLSTATQELLAHVAEPDLATGTWLTPLLTVVAWVGAFVVAGVVLFRTRDV